MLDLGGVILKLMQNPKNEIQRGSIPRMQEKGRRSILGLMGVVEMKNGRLVVIPRLRDSGDDTFKGFISEANDFTTMPVIEQ